jgi:hypothetical protein
VPSLLDVSFIAMGIEKNKNEKIKEWVIEKLRSNLEDMPNLLVY